MPFGPGSCLPLFVATLGEKLAASSAAEYCPDSQSEIQTDRPDVTNSSFVVPTGSLQAENGINLTARGASRSIDGTNARLAYCTQLLVDLPAISVPYTIETGLGFRTSRPLLRSSLDRFSAVLCSLRQPVWASSPGRAGSRSGL